MDIPPVSVQVSVKAVCQLSLGGFIIFFFISSLETLAASRLDSASIVTGSACYLALHFALPLLRCCICSFISELSIMSQVSACLTQTIFGRGMLWGAYACQAPPQCLHPAAADPGSLCPCQPQRGGQDNLLQPLAAKQWCGLVVFTCWEVKPVPQQGFEIHPWQRCFDYNYLNALLTWMLLRSSQNGF